MLGSKILSGSFKNPFNNKTSFFSAQKKTKRLSYILIRILEITIPK